MGAPRVLMLALARAGQVSVLTGDGDSAGASISRLLRLLRDKGVTYWADEALAVAALVLADRLPEDAAVILTSRRSFRGALDDTGNQLDAMSERLQRCRAQLLDRLGPARWREAEQETLAMPIDAAIVGALASLENLSRQ